MKTKTKRKKAILKPLSHNDKMVIPQVIELLLRKTNKDNLLAGWEIVEAINRNKQNQKEKIFITQSTLRKIINSIRGESKLPILSTSKGYYVSYSKRNVIETIESLQTRVEAQLFAIKGLQKIASRLDDDM